MNKKIATLVLLSLSIGIYFLFFYNKVSEIKIDSLSLFDDANQSVDVNKSNPRIYSFFQTWCGDCVRETPVLVSFCNEHNIDLYLVTDEDKELVDKYKSRFDFDFSVYYSNIKLKELGIYKYPTIMMYDGDKLISTKLESITQKDLDEYLNSIKK